MIYLILSLAFLVSCSSPTTDFEETQPTYLQESAINPDTLSVLSQTLGIGFSVSDLIVVDKTDSVALFNKLEDILIEFNNTNPSKRTEILSQFYDSIQPDVIALQELSQMYHNDVLISDFPNEILDYLNRNETVYKLYFQPLNDLALQVKRFAGDTLRSGIVLEADTLLIVDFNEGNAIYVKSSLSNIEVVETLYDNLVSFPFLDGDFISQRGHQLISFSTDKRDYQIFNTHLEISDNGLASYSKNQATELLLSTQEALDTSITQLALGNVNFEPGLGGQKILTASNDFIDLSSYSIEENQNTCCLELEDSGDFNSRQVDYIFGRHFYEINSFININPPTFDTNWPATHSALVIEIVSD